MTIYYKYYSYLPLEYFDNPNIKVASTLHLNDPFESLIPGDIKEIINNFACYYDKYNQSEYKITKEKYISAMISGNDNYGIVSLSETQKNLLMWAHYADNHKGLCIGYDTDLILLDDDVETLKRKAELQKVKYSKVRHEFYGKQPAIHSDRELADYIIYNLMLTKGCDWEYEKEYRYLIPFHHVHYLKIDRKEYNSVLEESVLNLTNLKVIKELKENIYIPYDKDKIYAFVTLTRFKEVSYYMKINSKSIKTIYFGCRASEEYINSIRNKLSNKDHCLHHVNIEEFKLSEYKFEISTIR